MNERSIPSDAPVPAADTAVEHVYAGKPGAPKRRALIVLAGVAALFAGAGMYRRYAASSDNGVAGVTIHSRPLDMPPLRFTDETGASTSVAAFHGRVVVLNVWATWCTPCREEMPTLDRLQSALGGPDFEVVTVSVDTSGLPVVQAFFRQIGVKHLRPYLDTFQDAIALVATGIPLTLLIDREGREIGRKLGPAKWDDPQMLRLIRRNLPAALPAPAAAADVVVADAWARPTVPGQPVGAAYFSITSAHAATLTGMQSDASGTVQVHSMTQEGDVMRMREVDRLDLPAGKTVRLVPSGMHLMLLDLKKPLRTGDSVGLDLTVVDKGGARHVVHAIVPVRATPPEQGKP